MKTHDIGPATYTVRIGFCGKRPEYSKSGLPLWGAIALKEYFLERVPPAVWGSVTPEVQS